MRVTIPRPQPRLAEALINRSPAAAVIVDELDRVVMANAQSIPVLQQLFGRDEPQSVLGELPDEFKPKLRALRGALEKSAGSPLLQVAPELCVRASLLNDGARGFLLLLFERMARRNQALHNLQSFGLTPREKEVAMLVLYGLSNRAIANRLSLAEYTVEGHIKRILTKVGARSRSAFVSRILGWPVAGQESSG